MYQGAIKVYYHFLEQENADYSGMARAYRSYLSGKDLLPQNEVSDELLFYLDLIGAVSYEKSVLGIPVTGRKAITSYQNAIGIAQKLSLGGVSNLNIKYLYWANDGIETTLNNKVKLISELGGKPGFQSLVQYTKENSIRLYPDMDVSYVYHDKMLDGFSKNCDAARSLSDFAAGKYVYNVSTNRDMYYNIVVSPRKYGFILTDF